MLLLFGLLTLGLGLPLLGVLPFVPFCYHLLFVAGPASRHAGPAGAWADRPAQRRSRAADAGCRRFVFTLVFYLTLATTGLLLLVALFTVRHRTLHDLAERPGRGARRRALTRGLGSWNMQGGSPYA